MQEVENGSLENIVLFSFSTKRKWREIANNTLREQKKISFLDIFRTYHKKSYFKNDSLPK